MNAELVRLRFSDSLNLQHVAGILTMRACALIRSNETETESNRERCFWVSHSRVCFSCCEVLSVIVVIQGII